TLVGKLHLAVPPFMREVKINEWRYFIYTMLNMGMLSMILLGYIWFQLEAGVAIAAGTLVTVYMYQDRVGRQGFDFMSMHSNWLGALTNLRATQEIMDDHARLAKDETAAPPPAWQEISLNNL